MEAELPYLMKVLPTPGSPWPNKAAISGFPLGLPSNQFRYSSLCKSQSPTALTRCTLMLSCRIRGSSGDSHTRISALSLAPLKLFTVLKELLLLKEFVLALNKLLLKELLVPPTKDCDILSLFFGVWDVVLSKLRIQRVGSRVR